MGVTATRTVKYIRKGVGISYTDVEYADSTSNSVAPTSGWQTTAPAWQNGHYIWQRIKFTYTDGNTAYSRPVCLSGGKGIASIAEYYLATSASSGVTTATSGWTTSVQSVTASKKYLWNYEVVTYTDGTTTTTTPVIIGTYGDKGAGITSITEHYLATSAASGVTRSTSGWTTSIQTVTNTNKYLWNYETVTYTDGTTQDTDPVIIGVYGDTGVGISSVTEYYLATASSSGVTTSTSGWTTSIQTATATKKYLWNYEKITYSNGTTSTTTPVIIGTYGDKGVGITSITEHYLATSAASGVTHSTSGWTTSIQTVTNTNKYLWNYETVTYTDGTTQDTDPVIIGVYGDKGDTTGVNPNILLRTIFDNGISPVKQAWSANWSYTDIGTAADTIVQGRKSIRINASSLSASIDFTQNVYGRIKASTWYTLSFNYFATAQFQTFLWDGANTYGIVERYAGYYIDGVLYTSDFGIDGSHTWPADWSGTRHTITFKTRSSFGTAAANILFRTPAGCQLAICMPKLEEGKEATAYVAHEDDLKGANGDSITGPRGYRGPGLRGPQDWNIMEVGYQFYKGDADLIEPYEDFVVYNGNYYKCIKSHTKTATNYPGSTYDTSNGLWQLSDKLAMVAANVLFAPHGYFGSAIISGDWMISTNGTIDEVAYNNGATYNGIIAYSLFNPNNPTGNSITKHNSTSTVSFGSSDTTKLLNSNTIYLESGKVYFVQATGRLGSSSGSVYVRLRDTSTGATYTPVMINGTSDVTRSGLINVTVTGNYYIEVYNNGGYTGQVSASKVVEKNFAPVFALDLLTGATYQGNANLKGNFTSENKTQGNTIRIDTQNGDFTMIGPQSVNDNDRLPSSDARMELAKILFATDPDALTRLAYMWLKNGANNKIINADPYYGVSAQDNILGDNRGAGFDADSFSISEGSGSSYRELYIDKYGVSLQIGVGSSATTKYKSWEQLLA